MRERDIVVVTSGGDRAALREHLPAGALVVAADGGVDAAHALGLAVDHAVGDFDSVSAAGLARVERSGAPVERHAEAKDETDLELALDAAVGMGAARVTIVGSDGGRLDHLLSTLLLVGSERYRDVELDALLGPARVHVVRGERRLRGEPGELVSLLALHGPATRVETDGLAYPLRGETLTPGSSRGVSNTFTAREARVALDGGVLLAVRPGAGERSTP